MDFLEIAKTRQSCRNFDATKRVEREKIDLILEAGRLAPSACNSQPYYFAVATGEKAKEIAKLTTRLNMNKFTKDANAIIVIFEDDYNMTAALGAKVKHNDYRSIDIGIASAYMTAQAHTLGLSSCIIGWFDDEGVRKICGIDKAVRLILAIGYAKEDDKLREKKRKSTAQLVKIVE